MQVANFRRLRNFWILAYGVETKQQPAKINTVKI